MNIVGDHRRSSEQKARALLDGALAPDEEADETR
jgi:plasmid stability protein